MGTGIYKYTATGKKELTSREVKAYIKKVNHLSDAQYKKQYDIFKNKLRAFEAYERHAGRKVETQSAVQLLYKQAKAKQQARSAGVKYKPSIKMRRIQSFTSVSSGKAGQKALQSKRYLQARADEYSKATQKQFAGLIKSNAQAKQIFNEIKDPVKREQALTDFANKLGAKIDEQDKVQENEAIPFGETYGSDAQIDFDIDAYK